MPSRYRIYALFLAVCLLLSACQKQSPVKTQSISDEPAPRRVQASSSMPGEPDAPSQSQGGASLAPSASSPQEDAPSGSEKSGAELLEEYYSLKAQKDAVEIDIENLEASLRTGKIGDSEFQQKLADYERLEDQLDAQKDALKDRIGSLSPYFPFTLPQDREGLSALLEELERQEDSLDSRKDALEAGYRGGTLGREEFLLQKAALEREDDAIGEQQDAAERALDKLPALGGHSSHSSKHHNGHDDWDDDSDDDDDGDEDDSDDDADEEDDGGNEDGD